MDRWEVLSKSVLELEAYDIGEFLSVNTTASWNGIGVAGSHVVID